MLYGIAAYVLWGLFPLYFPLLKPAGAIEILGHRMVWSLLAMVVILAVWRHWSWWRRLTRRQLGLLAVAGMIITVNWGTYIFAVNTGHTLEASLGYFINPLISVLFGVIVFRERLRPWQWAAVVLGLVAVVVLTADYGRLPWIALVLAGAFGTYGLIKKFANTASAESLTVETLVLFLPALGYLLILNGQGTGTFGHQGAGQALLLAGAGLLTVVPLLLFNGAAIRVPLTAIGMIQYIAPVLQFLIGLFIYREAMPASRWIGFLLVWGALVILTVDGLRAARSTRVRRAQAGATPASPARRKPAAVIADSISGLAVGRQAVAALGRVS
jgi:chloramphenicol-sensitive protein RarD